jgi:hypothetical protein
MNLNEIRYAHAFMRGSPRGHCHSTPRAQEPILHRHELTFGLDAVIDTLSFLHFKLQLLQYLWASA